MNRKNFLKVLGLFSLGILTFRSRATNFIKDIKPKNPRGKPIVISTWSHGLEANKAAWTAIKNKQSAFHSVEKGVRVTESDIKNQSVGIGGFPDERGIVTLDACIMNHKNECGSVCFLQDIEHPISVARKVMEETPHVMLAGAGAKAFALEQGFKEVDLLSEDAKKAWQEWKAKKEQTQPEINHENHDTIGMLAIDEHGQLSGACTTSGWAFKKHGRVGDSPIIGAGLFVDNEVGAACATGMGEAVIRIAGSHTVVELMRQGHSPQEACKMAVLRIKAKHENLKGLQVGFIAINNQGEHGGYSMYSGFNYALKTMYDEKMVDTSYELEW